MGGASSQLQETAQQCLTQILSEEPINTLISQEIHELTYDRFLEILSELNLLSRKCLDTNGKQLVFAVKKGSDSTLFWKSTVLIACVKLDPESNKVESYRLFSLNQLLKVFKTLKCQASVAEQTSSKDKLSVSNLLTSMKPEEPVECCCICFERKQEVILPCAHSYCLQCIEEWNESHDTCPICRAKLESTEDTWILSEVPKAEEICNEMRENLMELTEDKSPPCTPS